LTGSNFTSTAAEARLAQAKKKKRGYRVCSSGYAAPATKKKRGYRVCSSGYAATDTS
jgi:hypothetical protein